MTLHDLRRIRPGMLGLMLTLATPIAAQEPLPGPLDGFLSSVTKTKLPNGLTLLVREQPGTGVVAINTWVKAGYFNEPDEVAGMAHLFEHMFFKGSKKFPGAEQIITIDGLRADFKDGFGLIRSSNTTPVLVMRFEGHTAKALQRIQSAFMAALLAVKPDALIAAASH